jgi:hypothetical protein
MKGATQFESWNLTLGLNLSRNSARMHPLMYHNFARIHQSLRVTPAMEADVTGHIWTLEK